MHTAKFPGNVNYIECVMPLIRRYGSTKETCEAGVINVNTYILLLYNNRFEVPSIKGTINF